MTLQATLEPAFHFEERNKEPPVCPNCYSPEQDKDHRPTKLTNVSHGRHPHVAMI